MNYKISNREAVRLYCVQSYEGNAESVSICMLVHCFGIVSWFKIATYICMLHFRFIPSYLHEYGCGWGFAYELTQRFSPYSPPFI